MILGIVIGIGLAVACASPGLAQPYTASYGTGNVIDLPVLEKSNGRYGYGGTVAPRSRLAFGLRRSRQPRQFGVCVFADKAERNACREPSTGVRAANG